MDSLVGSQTVRLRERDDHDDYVALIEQMLQFLHLSEVLLAGQSGEMTEKNEQRAPGDKLLQADLPALQVE
jgi:hypothetical protein